MNSGLPIHTKNIFFRRHLHSIHHLQKLMLKMINLMLKVQQMATTLLKYYVTWQNITSFTTKELRQKRGTIFAHNTLPASTDFLHLINHSLLKKMRIINLHSVMLTAEHLVLFYINGTAMRIRTAFHLMKHQCVLVPSAQAAAHVLKNNASHLN